MKKINVAIVGYGNIGKFAAEAVQSAPDMELAGVIRRGGNRPVGLVDVPVADSLAKLKEVEAVMLCVPTRNVEENAEKYLKMGINTVDSFDIHNDIWGLRTRLNERAKKHNAVSVVAAGWDPGSDSVVRALLQACAPMGITYTNFGPGMSMGHSVAAKAIDGVADALSITMPLGAGQHSRMVYVQLEEGASLENVTKTLKADPYFCNDQTYVAAVEDVKALADMGHGVHMIRKGVSGKTHNQLFEFSMRVNNPALTAQVMTACVRAGFKQQPGAYTMVELPVIDLLYGDKEALVRSLV